MKPENELSNLAVIATQQIVDSLLEHFTTALDVSYKRAMFRQNGEYGCSLVIDVCLEDGDKKAVIKTKFGKV